MILRGGGKIDY